jgi:hypothetical protein
MSGDKIVRLVPKDHVPVEKVLEEVQRENLTDLLVIGWDKDGHLYVNSSMQDGAPNLWALECAKDALIHEARHPHDAG